MSIKRFFNVGIPVHRCNLNCYYCYLGQHRNKGGYTDESLPHTLDYILGAIHPERVGGQCLFNLCGDGETLLHDEIVDMARGFLSLGHYVSIITNATLRSRLEEFTRLPDEYRSRLFIKCSLHWSELERLSMVEQFFCNIQMLKVNRIAFSIEVVANDETVPKIPEIKRVCLEKTGALCHIAESRDEGDCRFPRLTNLPLDRHTAAWAEFDSQLFRYEQETYNHHQSGFCYAGVYGISLDLQSGNLYQCNGAKKFANIYEEIDKPIPFVAVGENCPLSHCFLSYVWASLCGCYTDHRAPTYAEERDRLTADGSHWLTPEIREAFGHRCSEYHEPYTENKAFFIDMLMRCVYRDAAPSDVERERLAHILGTSLSKKGYQRIAVYGAGKLGRWLISMLNHTEVEVAAVVDRRAGEVCAGEGIPVFAPDATFSDASFPDVDAIIVSVYSEFSNIAPLLRQKGSSPVVSIVELAGE